MSSYDSAPFVCHLDAAYDLDTLDAVRAWGETQCLDQRTTGARTRRWLEYDCDDGGTRLEWYTEWGYIQWDLGADDQKTWVTLHDMYATCDPEEGQSTCGQPVLRHQTVCDDWTRNLCPDTGDQDGDGYAVPACGGFDYDDTDATVHPLADRDGDGVTGTWCDVAGEDCDDADASRAPGFREICDELGHDEDCDPATVGERDDDGDGFVDARCRNEDSRGADCDDGNEYDVPGVFVCTPDLGPRSGRVCLDGVEQPESCPDGTICVPQWDGSGICGIP